MGQQCGRMRTFWNFAQYFSYHPGHLIRFMHLLYCYWNSYAFPTSFSSHSTPLSTPKTSSARYHPRKDRHSPHYFGRFTSKEPPICTKISSFQNIRTRLHQQMRLHRPCNDKSLLLDTCCPEASEMAYQLSAFSLSIVWSWWRYQCG